MSSDIPQGAFLKSISATYNEHTLPRELQVMHRLDKELWGKVVVEEGQVALCIGSAAQVSTVTPEVPGIIPADTPFCLKSSEGPVRFRIQYFHEHVLNDSSEVVGLLSRKPA